MSGSFVFSDAFDLPEWVTFGKLRAGYSDIGGGAEDPYVLSLSYGIFDNYTGTGNSVPLGRINNSQLPNKELKPFSKKEYEFGLNARFSTVALGLILPITVIRQQMISYPFRYPILQVMTPRS